MAEKFDVLSESLERFIENTRQLGIIVADFPPQGQNTLNQKLHVMVTGLQELDKLKSQVQDVQVPMEVFEYIDQGKNPQLYTKDCMEKAMVKNEQVKGKIDTMRKFKSVLILELSKMFPDEMDKYKDIRG
ncbi:mediator of RNA polymerase II transcription subunit 10-like [Anneissia japonica]|uniref:mediator of RNA polymerase II transcription subunit 10-like n=1 Tax=Anneissia japonica TaxID=1529436 RepID=UPI0014254E23|nr:mediator of RNA polymerase II transcription subunit 10-like [Anneissia japonica]